MNHLIRLRRSLRCRPGEGQACLQRPDGKAGIERCAVSFTRGKFREVPVILDPGGLVLGCVLLHEIPFVDERHDKEARAEHKT
jgi:hypothetical protein